MNNSIKGTFLDKNSLLKSRLALGPLELELGVGNHKRNEKALGIDLIDSPSTDLVGDAMTIISSLPDDSVGYIESWHFIEHVDDLPSLLNEITRVMQDGGRLRFVVPHFSNPFFYSDPTHRAHFGLYTFAYYAVSDIFSRSIPSYCKINGLQLQDVRFCFRSYRPHFFRHGLKLLVGRIVNSNRWLQELYEECFCWICPCYEVSYDLLISKN